MLVVHVDAVATGSGGALVVDGLTGVRVTTARAQGAEPKRLAALFDEHAGERG